MAESLAFLLFCSVFLLKSEFSLSVQKVDDLNKVHHHLQKTHAETVVLQKSEVSDSIVNRNNKKHGKITYTFIAPQRARRPPEELHRVAVASANGPGPVWKVIPNENPWSTLYNPSPIKNGLESRPEFKSSIVEQHSHMHADRQLLEKIPNSDHTSHEEVDHEFRNPPNRKDSNTVHENANHYNNTSKANPDDLEDVRLANEHFLMLRKEGRCKVPGREVICVSKTYPTITKEYLPRCTILHRCSDHTGCCESEKLSCVPKSVQEVSLSFYVIYHDNQPSEVSLENSVEKLLFENHTECHCAPTPQKTDQVHANSDGGKNLKQLEKNREVQATQSNSNIISTKAEDRPHESKPKCMSCPEPFYYRNYPDSRCGCDCFHKQKECLQIKRGRESLSLHERRCVEVGRCNVPDCEFGMYDIITGRCPKKPEQLQKQDKDGKKDDLGTRASRNQNHRWTFFERD